MRSTSSLRRFPTLPVNSSNPRVDGVGKVTGSVLVDSDRELGLYRYGGGTVDTVLERWGYRRYFTHSYC